METVKKKAWDSITEREYEIELPAPDLVETALLGIDFPLNGLHKKKIAEILEAHFSLADEQREAKNKSQVRVFHLYVGLISRALINAGKLVELTSGRRDINRKKASIQAQVPKQYSDEMVLPVLQHIADGQEHRRIDIINMLTERFSLTTDERRDLSDSGNMEKSLINRGCIERTRVGHYRITDHGREFLYHNPEGVPAFDRDTETGIESPAPNSHQKIDENYQQIREELAADLLEKIKNNTPAFFEKLVIDLLVKMGYGGSREGAGKAVGGSGDGGIDGIINEDRLGLDVIYVQAKRWEGNVGEPEIARFAGALAGKRATKGIFITTSDFTKAARAYDASGFKIVLVDGHQLAQLMIDHDVGVSVEKTYEIKRVDSDYFAEDTENS